MPRSVLIIIAILSIAVLIYAVFTVANATSIPFSSESISATSTPPSFEVYMPAILGQPMLSTPGAAIDLQSEVECEIPGKAVARLSWTVASIPGSAQRVDVTIYSFEGDQFESSGLLPPDQSSLVWEQLRGQAIHDWRVLTLHPEGWVPSETASFEGPTCVGDFEPTPIIIP